jgi:alkanesulfonate monooxygenase SsuD/methylene tetrahydromethanopterin reductase-like flavin-dependent oxidoreductase (luciferase family)
MPFPADRVRFGANLAPHPDPAEQFALAERAEALGFDALWCGDHIVFNIPLYESLTLLSFYAAHTKRIRVGTCVYLLALRHPTVVAKITATLDALSGGRLIFGAQDLDPLGDARSGLRRRRRSLGDFLGLRE